MNATSGRSATAAPVDPRALRWEVQGDRYWQGVVAAAAAAGCTTLVGLLVVRGLFGLPVLRRSDGGDLVQASTVWYLLAAFAATVLAATLLRLLLACAPRPWRFYRTIAWLCVTAATLAPFTFDAKTSTRLATALLHLAILSVAVIWVELVGKACAALVVDGDAL